jgi:membrane-associated phospholipid phosphatase
MPLFHSMADITLYSVAAVAGLLWLGTGKQPIAAVYPFLRSLVLSRKALIFFLCLLSILLINKYELMLERAMGIDYDLTKHVSGWEGSWIAALQSALPYSAVIAVSAFFYLVMFQSTMLASVAVYAQRNQMKLFYSFCAAVLANYIIAVPFYLFVPVNEVWFANPHVKLLMANAFPAFEQSYRAMSGINNCFPSLHTSVSVTIALIASRSGNRRWAAIAWTNAVLIIFSIFFLGIHWFTDMAAGVGLAFLASAIGLRVGSWAERSFARALPKKSGAEYDATV